MAEGAITTTAITTTMTITITTVGRAAFLDRWVAARVAVVVLAAAVVGVDTAGVTAAITAGETMVGAAARVVATRIAVGLGPRASTTEVALTIWRTTPWALFVDNHKA